jgi:hypothetical protein
MIPAYCDARCLPAADRLVVALLNVASSCASAARSSRARLGDGIARLATAGIIRTGSKPVEGRAAITRTSAAMSSQNRVSPQRPRLRQHRRGDRTRILFPQRA